MRVLVTSLLFSFLYFSESELIALNKEVIIKIIIIMSLFYEDNIFSTTTNLTYGLRLKNKHEDDKTYLQYIHKNIKMI